MHGEPVEQTSPHELRLKRLISARGLATRYGIHLRSVARWVARGVIPPPDQIICDRRYWLAHRSTRPIARTQPTLRLRPRPPPSAA